MVTGCDISRYQTPVNFIVMKAAEIDFVICRGYFDEVADLTFPVYHAGAGAVGMIRGVYHFANYRKDPVQQASLLGALYSRYPTELPPALDFEWYSEWETLSRVQALAWIKLYVTRVDSLTGRTCMFYCNRSMLQFLSPLPDWLKVRALWISCPDPVADPGHGEFNKWTFWQYTYKGDGPAYGVTSLDLDMDRFNGTLAELKAFCGIQPDELETPDTTEGVEPMTDWKLNARGVHIPKDKPAPILEPYDFVVAEIGTTFHANVQAAHDEKIPIFLFAPSMLDKSRVDQGPDVVDWKPGAQPIIKELDKYILVNGVKRAIHGIVIDCSAIDNGEGKPLSGWWIATYSDWLLNEIYKRYTIPVYMYMNGQPMNAVNTEGAILINNLIDEWGICVVSPTATIDGWPVAAAKPSMPTHVDASITQWYLWLYKTVSPMLWLYNGTVSALYKELNFADVPPILADGDDTDQTPITDKQVAELWLAVKQNTTAIEALKVLVTKIVTRLTTPL